MVRFNGCPLLCITIHTPRPGRYCLLTATNDHTVYPPFATSTDYVRLSIISPTPAPTGQNERCMLPHRCSVLLANGQNPRNPLFLPHCMRRFSAFLFFGPPWCMCIMGFGSLKLIATRHSQRRTQLPPLGGEELQSGSLVNLSSNPGHHPHTPTMRRCATVGSDRRIWSPILPCRHCIHLPSLAISRQWTFTTT